MPPGRRSKLLRMLVLLLPACADGVPQPRVLRLRQATPEPGATGVYLNEAVELFFSDEVDPASVHAQSARILSLDGVPARGRWEVSGRRLTFTPDPVLAPDLSDGGYRPEATYRVELSGFPRPDGLRGLGGEPLPGTLRWEFNVVSAGQGRHGFLFEDSSLERGLPLVLRTFEVPPGGPIVLEGEEPLDPSTLFGEDFLLQPQGAGGRQLAAPIPLRARLAQNFDKRAPRRRGTTLVELIPQVRLESGASYRLQMKFQARLRDFGGHPVPYLPTLSLPALAGQSALIHVRESSLPPADVYLEPFLSPDNRSPEVVPGADGTAWWGDSGRVEVRFPRAAGDGRDGPLELRGRVEREDLHAVRILIPRDAQVELPARPGLVVVRAQGALRVEGALARRAPVGEAPVFLAGESVSRWLSRVASEGGTATVLVAGGDLTVTGELEVAGPLVLVAGGRLRLERQERIRAGEIHVLPEAARGQPYLDPVVDKIERTVAAPLELDLVRDNPLVEPLTFAVRSGPIPREGQAARWRGPPRIGGHAGTAGDYRVRFVGSSPGRGLGERSDRVVEDPEQLTDSPSLRLQVELLVRPAASWDPPWVDFVEVSWDPVGAERPR